MAGNGREFKTVGWDRIDATAALQIQSLPSLNILKENAKPRSVPYRTSPSWIAASESRHCGTSDLEGETNV
jgi:hypothetical protein